MLIHEIRAAGRQGKDGWMILTELYGHLYRNLLFPFYDSVLRRRKTYSYYREVSGYPYLSVDEIENMRRQRLRSLIAYCGARVPYYRDLFRRKGVDHSRVEDVSILREAGISLTKEEMRANSARFMSDEFRKEDLVCNFTAGTTGVPLDLYKTIDYWSMRMAIKLRSEDWIGKRPGTPSAMIWGHKANLGPAARARLQLYWNFQNYRFLSALDIEEENLSRYVREIRRWGARYIESYVNPVYLMAKVIEKAGIEPPRLDGIVIGGERLEDFQKEKMESVFGCNVYNRFGCSEFTNISCECEEHRGQHINADNLWVEVVDRSGRPVMDEEGEVVVTDLMNFAMPFIRYSLNDTAIMTSRKCSCGRNFPMFEKVIGKKTVVFTAPDGFECHSKYFQWSLYSVQGIFRFQVVQKSSGVFVVRLIPDGTVSREEIEKKVRTAFSELGRHGVTLVVEFVDEIELTSGGKMSFFVSERNGQG